MSFNIGSGFVTAQISFQRLHHIRDNVSLPQTSLWERIKEFFFSTHQREALDCLHRLYHHADYEMSSQDIRDTFIRLQKLASPGHRDKFIIDSMVTADIYKIDEVEILSVPASETAGLATQGYETWYDCHNDDSGFDRQHSKDIWQDCHDDDSGFDSQPGYDIWHDCQDDSIQPPGYQDRDIEADVTEDDSINLIDTAEISALSQQKISKEDDKYLQCILNLDYQYRHELVQTGLANFVSRLGAWNASRCMIIGNRISKNIYSQMTNVPALRKDVAALLKISGVMQLLPADIMKSPEFAIIQRMNAEGA